MVSWREARCCVRRKSAFRRAGSAYLEVSVSDDDELRSNGSGCRMGRSFSNEFNSKGYVQQR